MSPLLPIVCVFLTLLSGTNSAKILGVFPMPVHSHFSLGFRLMKELADKGHEVTFINSFPQKTPIKNLRDISTSFLVEKVDALKGSLFDWKNRSMMATRTMFSETVRLISEEVLASEDVQKLLTEDFDVVIVEYFFNAAHVGLGYHFNAPVVLVTPMTMTSALGHIVGNPSTTAFTPNPMLTTDGNEMTFFERVKNLIMDKGSLVFTYYLAFPLQNQYLKKHIPGTPDLSDIIYNCSIVLVNSHPSFSTPGPLVPNVIEIGGYHVNPPKQLPKDLQDYLDKAKDGFLLFSMGSNLKGSDMSPEMLDVIVNSFGKIKQKVLWKFEKDIPNLPENMKILKWIPQQDVLAHPNIKAFVTHGGLLSTIETIYHGVPIIGIPVFGDQDGNMAKAQSDGYGIAVPYNELTEEKLTNALFEILNNPKYRENAKYRSQLMHDRPVKPIDTAIYWIEYVIRHRGAPHLKSPALKLRWFQENMLDVWVFLVAVTSLIIFIICKTVRWAIKLLKCSKTSIIKKKQ